MNGQNSSRRDFLKLVAGVSAGALAGCKPRTTEPLYKISLAQWSLNRHFWSDRLDRRDFARISKQEFGVDAIEYVNQFYFDTLNDELVKDLKDRSESEGVKNLLIMCDREGMLGHPDETERAKSVANHHRWADAAHALGCHSIRVNAFSEGTFEDQMKYAADGLNQLSAYCAPLGLDVIVENHGGLSSHGGWLAGVMKLTDNPRVGTLPDFGNFIINRETGESYDVYKGTAELMPYAKGVSGKTFNFDEEGNETSWDYRRLMQIVVDSGFRGYVDIEYEGENPDEFAGIRKTKALLERLRDELSAG